MSTATQTREAASHAVILGTRPALAFGGERDVASQSVADDEAEHPEPRHGAHEGERAIETVAEVKALEKVDHDSCEAEHLAALNTMSHRDEVLKAAIGGLVKLKSAEASARISKLLESDLTPERRVALIGGLARLKPENVEIITQLHEQLDNNRTTIRRKAGIRG